MRHYFDDKTRGWQRFDRSLLLRLRFSEKESNSNDDYLAKFAVKGTSRLTTDKLEQELEDSDELRVQAHLLDGYRTATQQLLRTTAESPLHINAVSRERPNYTRSDKEFIAKLMIDKSITIKPADKNLGMVLVDTTWYNAELLRMLGDRITYQPFKPGRLIKGKHQQWTFEQHQRALHTELVDLTKRFQQLLKFHAPAQVTKYLQRSIPADKAAVPIIYLLIKVHKASGLCGRPIVPCTRWLTTPASVLADHLLQEVLRSANLTHLVKDTKSFVVELEQTVLPTRDGVFVTADIASLYTNIDTKLGLQLVSQFLIEQKVASELATCIMALLSFVMNNSYLQFEGTIYQQIDGTAMGTACAPTYANIVVYMLERPVLDIMRGDLQLYRRFLDDVLAYVTATRANELMVRLNQLHRKIRFEFVVHSSTASFLDLQISKGHRFNASGVFDLAVHQKSMNLYLYIPYLSYHPEAMKRSFIQTELTRYIRNSSDRNDYVRLKHVFYQRLRDRGYPPRFLLPLFNTIFYDDRSYFLWPAIRPLSEHPLMSTCPPISDCLLRRVARQALSVPTTDAPPVFVIPYSPLSASMPTRELLLRNWHRVNQAMNCDVPRPLIAYQSCLNLIKQLVHLRARNFEKERQKSTEPPKMRQLQLTSLVSLRPTHASPMPVVQLPRLH
jgi:hypothetical protein